MTAPSAYCVDADVYELGGLPRGALPNPGRLIAEVSTGTEILTLDGHGFRAGAKLLFRPEGGGSLPAPLVAGTTYYALPLTDSTFQVAATSGGSPINLTTAGSRVVVSTPLPMAGAIEWASALIDDMLPAHAVPLTSPYPAIVVATAAELAAWRLLSFTGGASADALSTRLANAQRVIDRWAKGLPIRGANVPPAAGLAVVAATMATDARGWIPADGRLP